MKVRINRQRRGKKIQEAPAKIELYNDAGRYIGQINFDEDFNEVKIMHHNSDKDRTLNICVCSNVEPVEIAKTVSETRTWYRFEGRVRNE